MRFVVRCPVVRWIRPFLFCLVIFISFIYKFYLILPLVVALSSILLPRRLRLFALVFKRLFISSYVRLIVAIRLFVCQLVFLSFWLIFFSWILFLQHPNLVLVVAMLLLLSQCMLFEFKLKFFFPSYIHLLLCLLRTSYMNMRQLQLINPTCRLPSHLTYKLPPSHSTK